MKLLPHSLCPHLLLDKVIHQLLSRKHIRVLSAALVLLFLLTCLSYLCNYFLLITCSCSLCTCGRSLSTILLSSERFFFLLFLEFLLFLLLDFLVGLALLRGHILERLLLLLFLGYGVDYGALQESVTKDATSVLSKATGEWSLIPWLIGGCDLPRIAFSAPALWSRLFLSDYSGCTLKDTHSEVTLVALQAPPLLVVVLNAEVAFEALDTEVNSLPLRLSSKN